MELELLSLVVGKAVGYIYITLRLGRMTTVFPKATPVAGINPPMSISFRGTHASYLAVRSEERLVI